jgi:hypothetical protein
MEEKRPVGKPPIEITPDIISKAENYASRGLTKEQIAHCLGMGYSTLFEKINDYPELAEALKRGKSNGVAMVADNLLKNVKKGNVTAQIFFLKCQANWKETSVVETTGKDGAALPTAQNVTNVMIDERIAQMIKPKDGEK